MDVSGQLHATKQSYPPGKSPCYPLDKRMSGPQSRSRSDGEVEKKNPIIASVLNRIPVVQIKA